MPSLKQSDDSQVVTKGSPFQKTRSALTDIILHGLTVNESVHRDTTKTYASDGADCPRRAAKFCLSDATATGLITPSSMMYMNVGSAVHSMITDALFRERRLVFKEYRLPKLERIEIRGIIDALYVSHDGYVRGLEVKTCGRLPTEIKREHRAQAVTYEAMTGFEFDVLYVSRDIPFGSTQIQLVSLPVSPTVKEMHDNIAAHALAHLSIGLGKVPPIPMHFTSERDCRFCPFTSGCWGGHETFTELRSSELTKITKEADAIADSIMQRREHRNSGILKFMRMNSSSELYGRNGLDSATLTELNEARELAVGSGPE